jgi:hypothetical protein
MTAPQIHPEDLLDRARNGSLGGDEHRLLKKHLALCAACRFELSLAPGLFAFIELPSEDDALLARAIARTSPVRRAKRGAGRRAANVAALVAAAAAVAAMASAGAYAWRRQVVARLEAPAIAAPRAFDTPEPTVAPTPAPHADAVVEPLRPAPPEPSPRAERPKPRAAAPPVAPPVTCADRFRRANETRRVRRTKPCGCTSSCGPHARAPTKKSRRASSSAGSTSIAWRTPLALSTRSKATSPRRRPGRCAKTR